MTVEYHLALDNIKPDGYTGWLDWDKSIRGRKILGIDYTPWQVTKHSDDMLDTGSGFFEAESAPPLPVRVRAVPRDECGWKLDRWYIRYTNGYDVIRTEERDAGGATETTINITPFEAGLLYVGWVQVYPYFVFVGTGKLLGTQDGDALAGCKLGGSTPFLIIDL